MSTPPKIDETDRKILRALRADGRLTNLKLAEQVGLSPTPCWNRVRALEEAGVIEGYAALLNQKALGLPDTVMIEVTLEHHDDDTLARFGNEITRLPEVVEAFLVTGEYDYRSRSPSPAPRVTRNSCASACTSSRACGTAVPRSCCGGSSTRPRSSRDAWVPSVRRRRAASAQSVQELVDRAVERAWIAQVHAMRRAGDVDAPRLRQPARQRIQHGG